MASSLQHRHAHDCCSVMVEPISATARGVFSFLDINREFLVTSWTITHLALSVIFVGHQVLLSLSTCIKIGS